MSCNKIDGLYRQIKTQPLLYFFYCTLYVPANTWIFYINVLVVLMVLGSSPQLGWSCIWKDSSPTEKLEF